MRGEPGVGVLRPVNLDGLQATGMRKRFIWLGVSLAAFGLLTLAVGLLLWQAPPRTVTLVNGIKLDCLGATYGTNHVQPGTSRLAQLLPQSLRVWLGLSQPAQTVTTATPSLAIWLREDPSSLSNRVGRAGIVMGGLLADERGIVAGNFAPHFFWSGGSRGAGAFALIFRSVPRRSRELTLRLVHFGAESGERLVGRLTLRNPVYRRAPHWAAEEPPVCRTNGPITCRLEALATGLEGSSGQVSLGTDPVLRLAAAAPDKAPRALAVVRFEAHGLPVTDWTVGKVHLTDAAGNLLSFEDGLPRPDRTVEELVLASRSGNLLTSESRVRPCAGGLVVQYLDATLWPDEVWGVTVWAKRNLEASPGADELIELEGIRVSELAATNRLEWVFQRQGTEVRIERLGPGPASSVGSRPRGALARLRVAFPGLVDGGFCDVLGIEDELGRAIGWSRSEPVRTRPGELVVAIGQVPEGATTLSVRIVVQQGRRFDFRVRPEVVGTNGFQMALGG